MDSRNSMEVEVTIPDDWIWEQGKRNQIIVLSFGVCMNSNGFKRSRRYFSYFYKVELKLSVVDRPVTEASFNFSDDHPEGCWEQAGQVNGSSTAPSIVCCNNWVGLEEICLCQKRWCKKMQKKPFVALVFILLSNFLLEKDLALCFTNNLRKGMWY